MITNTIMRKTTTAIITIMISTVDSGFPAAGPKTLVDIVVVISLPVVVLASLVVVCSVAVVSSTSIVGTVVVATVGVGSVVVGRGVEKVKDVLVKVGKEKVLTVVVVSIPVAIEEEFVGGVALIIEVGRNWSVVTDWLSAIILGEGMTVDVVPDFKIFVADDSMTKTVSVVIELVLTSIMLGGTVSSGISILIILSPSPDPDPSFSRFG